MEPECLRATAIGQHGTLGPANRSPQGVGAAPPSDSPSQTSVPRRAREVPLAWLLLVVPLIAQLASSSAANAATPVEAQPETTPGATRDDATNGVATSDVAISGDAPSEETPSRGDSRVLRQLAMFAEPNLQGKLERLPSYVRLFRDALANDPRLFAFAVAAQASGGGAEPRAITLTGYVEFRETREGLADYLELLGFSPIENQISLLPEAALGAERFGLVTAGHTFSYDSPTTPRSVVTECLIGESVFVLREEAGHLLVHAGDGYLGYVAADDVRRVTEAERVAYESGTGIRVTKNFVADDGRTYPAGARLKLVASQEHREAHEEAFQAELPSGQIARIARSHATVTRPPIEAIATALDAARALLGTPYVWGGKTSAGVDCSGLVQLAFCAVGTHLPRDSNQQVLLGRLTATRSSLAGLQPGDTLYFLGTHGRIRHTALYLGNCRYIQAEMPEVEISSLDPGDADFDPQRRTSFAFAKRLWD